MNGIKNEEEIDKPQSHDYDGGFNLNEISSSKNNDNSKALSQEHFASIFLQKQQQQYKALQQQQQQQQQTKQSKQPVPVKPFPKVHPLPCTNDRLQHKTVFGLVRGSPYGARLSNHENYHHDTGTSINDDPNNNHSYHNGAHNQTYKNENELNHLSKQWAEWRKKNFTPLHFPIEGFDHIYGSNTIEANNDYHNHDDGCYGAEEAAIAAHNPMALLDHNNNDNNTTINNTSNHTKEGREYGSIRTPIDAPIGSLKDKWRVLPHFLQVRSLMRQHIDSFDYFVNTEMKEIVQSPSACEIRSEHDPKFYLRYTDCWVGEPSVQEDSYTPTQVTPFQCRLRDCTYSAPIYVNVRYTRGRQIVVKKKVRNMKLLSLLKRSLKVCLINVSLIQKLSKKKKKKKGGSWKITNYASFI
jgi:hypothetical protein